MNTSKKMLLLAFIVILSSNLFANPAYDTTRFYHLMDKARNGDTITLGYIGGSITEGYAASSTSMRWVNQVTSWWSAKFPDATVQMINAGIGGTGSDIGTFRIHEDLLSKNVDAVFVEFSVNDEEGELAEKMMEGLVRQALLDTNKPAVLLLMLKQESGANAQASHKPIAEHYDVPYVSYVDKIDSAVAADGITLHSIYEDGVHPKDAGMTYIANFIKTELDTIYKHLPASIDIKDIPDTIPDPLVTDVYSKTFQYTPNNLVPETNTGWDEEGVWTSGIVGSEISFEVDGNAFAVTYEKHNYSNYGRVELWVDDGPKTTLDAYWTETWGPATKFSLIDENLADGKHTFHVKVIAETSTGGHFFKLIKVLKAGNIIQNAPPISVVGDQQKVFTGTTINLDGSNSYDPEDDPITSYNWTVERAPASSTAKITGTTNVTASFIPDVEGVYEIGLTVASDTNVSVIRTQHIRAVETNTPPVANAGNDTIVETKKYAYPSAKNSYDPDGDYILYNWSLVSIPEGSSRAKLYYLDSLNNVVKTDVQGDYVIVLTVNDSLEDSAPDTLIVTALNDVSFDENNSNNIKVYPNPASDQLTINLEDLSSGNVLVALTSIDGKKLFEKNYSAGTKEVNLKLGQDIKSQGMVLLVILSEEKIYTAKVFIE